MDEPLHVTCCKGFGWSQCHHCVEGIFVETSDSLQFNDASRGRFIGQLKPRIGKQQFKSLLPRSPVPHSIRPFQHLEEVFCREARIPSASTELSGLSSATGSPYD